MNTWEYNDGGRRLAGYRGDAGDCAVRAVAIATGLPYALVYRDLAARQAALRFRRNGKMVTGHRSARNGVNRRAYEPYLFDLGWLWCPTMEIGSGTAVHLRADELPEGRIICRVSRHLVAVVDGVVHDTFDSSRDGTRAVYGYYEPGAPR